jgi:hypothetical protein
VAQVEGVAAVDVDSVTRLHAPAQAFAPPVRACGCWVRCAGGILNQREVGEFQDISFFRIRCVVLWRRTKEEKGESEETRILDVVQSILLIGEFHINHVAQAEA